MQDHLFGSTRRPYIRPAAVWVDCSPVPQHWDPLTSEIKDLDISEEDGYILSANGEGSTSGVFVPCEPLSAIRRARPGRLRIRPLVLHRRRVVGITTSPISPTVSTSLPPSYNTTNPRRTTSPQSSSGVRIRGRLPPTPSTPNTDFKNLFNSLRQRDAHHAAKVAPAEVSPTLLISPPASPAVSRTPPSLRQQRPVLHVQTSSPVGTSAPPPTPSLPSPSPSPSQFRPSGRLPKRPALPVWPAEYYPRAVVV
jgi:hypothetical protein